MNARSMRVDDPRRSRAALLLVAIVSALVLPGCSGNGEGEGDQAADTAADSAAGDSTEPTPGPQPQDAPREPTVADAPPSDDAPEPPPSEPTTEPAPEPEVQPEPAASEPDAPEPFTQLGIEDLVVGDGELVEPGATVTIHYRGTLASDGSEFDSSYSRGQPATFPLSSLIAGWQEGIPGMRVGGTRRLEIPWAKAYGASGRPPTIPPMADLIFQVEVLGVENPPKPPQLATEFEGEPVDLGDGLVIRDIAVGSGDTAIEPGAPMVLLHFVGAVADTGEIYEWSRRTGQPVTLRLANTLPAFERGVVGMKAGGVRRIEAPAALAFGDAERRPPGVPAGADLVFEVEVLSFRNARKLAAEWLREEDLGEGLVRRVVREGDAGGAVLPDDASITIHLIGELQDGTRIDSTYDAGQPITIPLGKAVEGWKRALPGMRPGGVIQIVMPPELGFGSEGSPPLVPPDATLVYEIELINWKPVRTWSTTFASEPEVVAEGITIRDVLAGTGDLAEEGRTAVVHYLAQLEDGTQVADTFSVNQLQVVPLVVEEPLPGLRRALIGMRVGGVRRVELTADQAFGDAGNEPLVPPGSAMVFEVELIGLQ
ncbi:MAG: FKBP-type peptidyl-prolyl cis-trans isomerase [Planctomycetota bacterium]